MSALTAILARDQAVSPQKIEEAIQRQALHGGEMDLALLEVDAASEDILTAYTAAVHRLPAMRRDVVMSSTPEARSMLSRAVCESLHILPIREENDRLVLAVVSMPERRAIEEIARTAGMPVELHATLPVRMSIALAWFYGTAMSKRVARIVSGLDAKPLITLPNVQPFVAEMPVRNIPVAALEALNEEEDTLRMGPPPMTPPVPHNVVAPHAIAPQLSPSPPLLPEREAARTIPDTAPVHEPKPETQRPLAKPAPQPTPQERLAAATNRDEIVDVLLNHAAPRSRLSCLFLVHGEVAEGLRAVGPLAPEHVRALRVPLDIAGAFASLRDTGDALFGLDALTLTDRVVLEDMGRPNPLGVLLAPIAIGSKLVLILWMDRGVQPLDPVIAEEILALCNEASEALARLIRERKRSKGATSSTPPKAADSVPVITPSATASTRAAVRTILDATPVAPEPETPEITLTVEDDEASQEEEQIEIEPLPPETTIETVLEVEEPRPTVQYPEVPLVLASAELVAELVAARSQRSESPYPSELRSLVTPSQSQSQAPIEPPPPSERAPRAPRAGRIPISVDVVGPLPERRPRESQRPVSVDPRREVDDSPLPPRNAHGSWKRTAVQPSDNTRVPEPPVNTQRTGGLLNPIVVPPVRTAAPPVGATGETNSLLADVMRTGTLTDAMATALLGAGERVLPSIFTYFPGPTAFRRLDASARLPLAADVGPLLRLVVMFRHTAIPYLLQAVERTDPDARYFATLCLGEVVSPTALPTLVPLLFDPDEAQRRAALDVLRGYRRFPEFDQVLRSLRSIVSDSAARVEHRKVAAHCLGEFRDAEGVPALLLPLGDRDHALASVVHRAVVTITRQDFGYAMPQWREWYERASQRHRVEWLIEALLHNDAVIRHESGEELKKLTGQFFGYYFNLPRRERERAWQRYREWWQAKGREQFGIK